jgi:hypothetical protein
MIVKIVLLYRTNRMALDITFKLAFNGKLQELIQAHQSGAPWWPPNSPYCCNWGTSPDKLQCLEFALANGAKINIQWSTHMIQRGEPLKSVILLAADVDYLWESKSLWNDLINYGRCPPPNARSGARHRHKQVVKARLRCYMEELVKKAWHPNRHIDWCLTYDERKAIKGN